MFVQKQDVHGGGKEREDGLSFGGLELLLAECLGIFDIGHHNELKRDIVFESLLVVLDKGLQTRVGGLTNHEQGDSHRPVLSFESGSASCSVK